jgi:SAM-dependent methyltransferase
MNAALAPSAAVRDTKSLACDACGSELGDSLFTLPALDGPYLGHRPVRKRRFHRCPVCGHLSADLYEAERLAEYYCNLNIEYHTCHDSDCSRYEMISQLLNSPDVNRVLDVGCGTGTFLKMLPGRVQRFGVEPGVEASRRARASGISIISLEDLKKPELRHSFDAVTAIDVIEHTKDLIRLRDYIAAALRPAGFLILLTGDADSKPAKLLGRYWYYLQYSEHVSFFSSHSMKNWLLPAFQDVEIIRSSHHPFQFRPWEMASLAKMYLVFPLRWLIHRFSESTRVSYPALWSSGDHMLVKARRR